MKSLNNIAISFGLTFTLVGMMSWNALPICASSRAAQAATKASATKSNDTPASAAAAYSKIAFVNVPGGNYSPDIYTMNPDGSDRQRLTFDGQNVEPAWSPDGTQIAFTRMESGSVYGSIFVMNADGSNQRQLNHSVFDVSNYHNPSWSPDGTKIAFSNNLFPGGGLYVMNADGSDQRRIGGFSFTKIAWSPDGSKLAVANSDGALDIIDVNGTGQTQITPQSVVSEDQEPAWSPDGSKIAFTRWGDCDVADCYSSDIWVVGADGSNPGLLAHYGSNPAWSPDGGSIVFSDGGDLFLMKPDGSDITNITNTKDARESEPSWQPFILSCVDSISPTNQSFDSGGGTRSLDLTAGGDCGWTAASNFSWITVASGSGSGSGSVLYSVGANTSTASRTGALIIAGRIFSISQAGLEVRITNALVVGKNLFITGENFDPGAVILLNGEQQRTVNDDQNPKTTLIARKAGKKINPGDKLQVRNPNGSHSQEIAFTGAE